MGKRPLTLDGHAGAWDDAHRQAMLQRFGQWLDQALAQSGLSLLELERRSAASTGGKPLINASTLWRMRRLATWTPESGKPQTMSDVDLLKLLWLCLDPRALDTSFLDMLAWVTGAWRETTERGRHQADAQLRAEMLASHYTQLTANHQDQLWQYARYLVDQESGGAATTTGATAASAPSALSPHAMMQPPNDAQLLQLDQAETEISRAERAAMAQEDETVFADLHNVHAVGRDQSKRVANGHNTDHAPTT